MAKGDPKPFGDPLASKETGYYKLPRPPKRQLCLKQKAVNRADLAARAATLNPIDLTFQLPDPGAPILPDKPDYSKEDAISIHTLPMTPSRPAPPSLRAGGSLETVKLPSPAIWQPVCSSIYTGQPTLAPRKQDLVRKADLKIFNLRSQISQTASKCLSCKLTDAEKQPEDEGCPIWCSLGCGLY